jgi:hypothetical protein
MIKHRYIAIALATIIVTIVFESSSLFTIATTTDNLRSPTIVDGLKMHSAPIFETTFDRPSIPDRTPVTTKIDLDFAEDTNLPPDNDIDPSSIAIRSINSGSWIK